MASSVTITAVGPSEPGALPGFRLQCEECGLTWGTSLPIYCANAEAAEHVAYHAHKAGRKAR